LKSSIGAVGCAFCHFLDLLPLGRLVRAHRREVGRRGGEEELHVADIHDLADQVRRS